ncbi:LysM peptidoglycan-binding domain-containing protein [Frondihabitans australicus]|uniref:LysM peptidoglycan-binding domain-containing protein n=1 Tax=Frondihabitans australicus TaxID=386892 RepID=UPI0011C410B3|nr:LysM domain-containing protein [Frondihabitans australicus]
MAGALALAGCTSLSPFTHPSGTASTATPGATASAPAAVAALSPAQKKVAAITAKEAAVAAAKPAAGTVVATAHVAAPSSLMSGAVSVTVTVVATGEDTYEIRTSDYHSSVAGAPYAIFFRQYPESVGDCIEDGVSFGYSDWGGPGVTYQSIPPTIDLSTAGDQPDFLKDVVLTTGIAAQKTTACDPWAVLAVAPLVWHLPNRHPGVAPKDTGVGTEARGTVTTTSTGSPLTYTVAPGDTETGIEARFGISQRDLHWLTAQSGEFIGHRLAAGDKLNLDPALA